MIRQTNWDGRDVLLVEVQNPNFQLYGNGTHNTPHWIRYVEMTAIGKFKNVDIHLPKGNWSFAFANPLHPTEAEAREWVFESNIRRFKDYTHADKDGLDEVGLFNALLEMSKKTAIESLHSRIRSEGFQHPERVVMLIKK